MSLFLLWGPPIMTGNGPKMVHFGPKMAKHAGLQACQRSKGVQKGPKFENGSNYGHFSP